MRMEQSMLFDRCRRNLPRRVAVAAAGELVQLQALFMAYREGVALPILCGDIEQIDRVARLNNIDISAFQIIETDSDRQALSIAASLLQGGRADLLMQGAVRTTSLIQAVGAGADPFLQLTLLDCPQIGRTLILTDGGLHLAPDATAKAQILQSAVFFARSLDVECPKVAPIAASAHVRADLPATMDAAALTVMNRRGQITDCLVDGPLPLDAALSPEAAARWGIQSEAAGQADILVFHDIEAALGARHALSLMSGSLSADLLIGAAAPTVLPPQTAASGLYALAAACACV